MAEKIEMLKKKINVEKLIDEIKVRPAIYDTRLPANNDMHVRKSCWEEITKVMFGEDVWNDMATAERDAIVKELQVKWRYVRDSYNRNRRKSLHGKRVTYVFFKKLSFLADFVKNQSPTPNQIFLQEDDTYENSGLSSEVNIKSGDGGDDEDEDIFDNENVSMDIGHDEVRNHGDERLSQMVQELVNIQKEDREDRMGNKKFLLSLLPFMEKLPDDVNLEVRLQLMSILQTYINGKCSVKM